MGTDPRSTPRRSPACACALAAAGLLAHDDLRLACSADAFSLHVAGQEDAPLLAAETSDRLVPLDCTWRVRTGKPVGTQPIDEVVISLAKEKRGGWPADLIKLWYI